MIANSNKTILAIDTSCDETSVSVLQGNRVIVHKISSQINLQNKWGGVVPMLAKRKHLERIEYLIAESLKLAAIRLRWSRGVKLKIAEVVDQLKQILPDQTERETPKPTLTAGSHVIQLKKTRKSYRDQDPTGKKNFELTALRGIDNPGIDLIAVTVGPGLAPALKVGLQAGVALAKHWKVAFTPVNHMEGHLLSGLIRNSKGMSSAIKWKLLLPNKENPTGLESPVLGLLASGGHTELIYSDNQYKIVGETLDDAAGEALDKFSVMLGFGYPGGPVIEKMAKNALKYSTVEEARGEFPLPIPMAKSDNLNFSFSGLKTAALYLLREKGGLGNPSNVRNAANSNVTTISLSKKQIEMFCLSFQYSVFESIRLKLDRALKKYQPKVLLTGGGVISNLTLRAILRRTARKYSCKLILPEKRFLVDNASMIGLIGHYNSISDIDIYSPEELEQDDEIWDRDPGLRFQ